MRTHSPSSAEHRRQHQPQTPPLAAASLLKDNRSETAQLLAAQATMSNGLHNQSLFALQAKMKAGGRLQPLQPPAPPLLAQARPAVQATPAAPLVIQRYEPKNSELNNFFLVQLVKEKRWIKATLTSIEKDRGWNFQRAEEEGDDIFIANHKNIKKWSEDGDSNEPKSGRKKSYFDSETTYTHCQHPNCGAKFENKDQLYDHVRLTHAFPQEQHYPYLLFGGQSALTHVLHRNTKEGEGEEEQQSYKGTSKATGSGYHSEWNAGQQLPKKRFKGSSHPEFSATTSVPEFMGKSSDAPSSLFMTGEPHCGLCSNTLPKSGLPLGYPTNAQPSQSQGYNIPMSAPNISGVFNDFSGGGKNPDYQTPDYRGFNREHFPSRLEKAPSYNNRLEEQHKKKGGEQYMKYMTQSMALTKDRYDSFFEQIGNGDMERDDLKRQMAQHPVPEHPQTFMPYCPSPLREPNDSEEDKLYEKQRQKILADRIIIAIAQAFKKIMGKGKPDMDLKEGEEEFLKPVAINNCLITAINGGAPAALDIVGVIRFLIKEQVGTPYGNYLQARPEVIYTIAQALQLTGRHIRIYMGNRNEDSEEASEGYDLELSQVFIIQGDGSVIEAEGDEVDDYPPPANGYIDIEHMGGNHFEVLGD